MSLCVDITLSGAVLSLRGLISGGNQRTVFWQAHSDRDELATIYLKFASVAFHEAAGLDTTRVGSQCPDLTGWDCDRPLNSDLFGAEVLLMRRPRQSDRIYLSLYVPQAGRFGVFTYRFIEFSPEEAMRFAASLRAGYEWIAELGPFPSDRHTA